MSLPRRYPTLDVLRVIAVVMTILVHTPSMTQRIFLFRPFFHGLWMGVDLFMLISGWLLGGQLLRESKAGPLHTRRFYFKRWMRTLPPYYALLLVFYAVHSSAPGAQFADIGLWRYLTHFVFLQTYLDTNSYMVSWSLCVEEHFYLILPLIIGALGRRARLRNLVLIVLATELFALYCRWRSVPLDDVAPVHTHMRAHGLFIGLLLAFLAQERRDLWSWLGRFAWLFGPLGILTSLALCASIPYLTQMGEPFVWEWVWCPTLVTWSLALTFVACVHEDCAWSRVSFRGLQYMGELTFAVYLVHDALPPSWLGEKISVGGALAVARRLGLIVGCAMILHHVVERPFLRLRARLLARGALNDPPAALAPLQP